jgi:hypothetical protein
MNQGEEDQNIEEINKKLENWAKMKGSQDDLKQIEKGMDNLGIKWQKRYASVEDKKQDNK